MRSACIPLLLLALAACTPAAAVITRVFPLGGLIEEADTIAVAKVETRDAKQGVRLGPAQPLKGNTAWARAQVRLAGGDDAKQIPALEARLKPGRQVILFTKNGRFTLGFVEGTWFRLAEPRDARSGDWQFVHLEPYLRKTYAGTSAGMRAAVTDTLSGKAAPGPNPGAKPGVGPP